MKLWEIHTQEQRQNISNLSLIVYDIKDYEMVKEKITTEAVKEHFKYIAKVKL